MPVRRDPRNRGWFFRKTVRVPDGRRVRIFGVPATFGLPNTKAGAQEAERREINRVLNTGVVKVTPPPKKEVTTFSEFADRYYLPKMRSTGNRRKNKPATLNAKESHLKIHLVPRFGDLPIEAIDELLIDDLKIELAEMGRSAKTINNVLSTLRNILVNARKRKVIAVVPDVEWLAVADQAFDFLDFDEGERLIAGAAKVPDWYCAILLALKTGMRLGELRALRWQDVDLVAGTVRVERNLWRWTEGTPKNGRARTIDLAGSAVAALKAHRHLRGQRVFLDFDGKDHTLGAWRHGLYRACSRAGLRRLGWHVLRHTTASHLAMRGESLSVIQAQLGHRTIQMTTRYAHLAPGATRAAVAKLDEPAPAWQRRGSSAKN